MFVTIKHYPFFLGKKRKRYVWSTPKRRHKKKSLPRGKMRVQEKAGGWKQLMQGLQVKLWRVEFYSKCNGKPLKRFSQWSDTIQAQFCYSVKNELELGKNGDRTAILGQVPWEFLVAWIQIWQWRCRKECQFKISFAGIVDRIWNISYRWEREKNQGPFFNFWLKWVSANSHCWGKM